MAVSYTRWDSGFATLLEKIVGRRMSPSRSRRDEADFCSVMNMGVLHRNRNT